MNALADKRAVPDKLFYKIGEVSRIAEVEPYVLRYWETEFPFLKPRKNRSGQRVYLRKDVETILLVKRLLYQEKYTIAGVRRRLGDQSSSVQKETPVTAMERIERVREGLRAIIRRLGK